MPFSHVFIKVAAADHPAVVNFYTQALKPLGSKQLKTFPNGMTAFGNQAPEWFVGKGEDHAKSSVHVAFNASGKLTRIYFVP